MHTTQCLPNFLVTQWLILASRFPERRRSLHLITSPSIFPPRWALSFPVGFDYEIHRQAQSEPDPESTVAEAGGERIPASPFRRIQSEN